MVHPVQGYWTGPVFNWADSVFIIWAKFATLGLVQIILARFFNSWHFHYFSSHFWPFFEIIQNLQNKIKTLKIRL